MWQGYPVHTVHTSNAGREEFEQNKIKKKQTNKQTVHSFIWYWFINSIGNRLQSNDITIAFHSIGDALKCVRFILFANEIQVEFGRPFECGSKRGACNSNENRFVFLCLGSKSFTCPFFLVSSRLALCQWNHIYRFHIQRVSLCETHSKWANVFNYSENLVKGNGKNGSEWNKLQTCKTHTEK